MRKPYSNSSYLTTYDLLRDPINTYIVSSSFLIALCICHNLIWYALVDEKYHKSILATQVSKTIDENPAGAITVLAFELLLICLAVYVLLIPYQKDERPFSSKQRQIIDYEKRKREAMGEAYARRASPRLKLRHDRESFYVDRISEREYDA